MPRISDTLALSPKLQPELCQGSCCRRPGRACYCCVRCHRHYCRTCLRVARDGRTVYCPGGGHALFRPAQLPTWRRPRFGFHGRGALVLLLFSCSASILAGYLLSFWLFRASTDADFRRATKETQSIDAMVKFFFGWMLGALTVVAAGDWQRRYLLRAHMARAVVHVAALLCGSFSILVVLLCYANRWRLASVWRNLQLGAMLLEVLVMSSITDWLARGLPRVALFLTQTIAFQTLWHFLSYVYWDERVLWPIPSVRIPSR